MERLLRTIDGYIARSGGEGPARPIPARAVHGAWGPGASLTCAGKASAR